MDTTLVRRCNESRGTTDCIVVLKEDYGDVLRDYVAVNLGKLRAKQTHEQQQAAQQQQQQAMQGRSNTCKGFGFKENTETHAQCMFDLFKLEQQSVAQQLTIQSQAEQNQALQSQAASNAASQRALLQQQIDQQNFNQGIQLLQQSQQLLNPPRPTTTCQWYDVTQTMKCR